MKKSAFTKILIGVLVVTIFVIIAIGLSRGSNSPDTPDTSDTSDTSNKLDDTPTSVASQGLSYVINDDGRSYSVYSGSCKDADVVIASTYNNLPVTTIGDFAFKDYAHNLTTITIPNSITSIGKEAFKNCNKLVTVTIPDSVKTIGQSAFKLCGSLNSVTIGSGIKTIDFSTFSRCFNLSSVVIPDSVETIRSFAFENCYALTKVTIGSGVKQMDGFVFDNCSKLNKITFNGTVEQWNNISKEKYWNTEIIATEVSCSNGTVKLK